MMNWLKKDLTYLWSKVSFRWILLLPFILIFIGKSMPYVGLYLPETEPYFSFIVLLFCTQTSASFAYLMANLLLFEREQQPSENKKQHRILVAKRSLILFSAVILANYLMVSHTDVLGFDYGQLINFAVLQGFFSLIVAFIVVLFAKTRFEGLVFFRSLTFLIFLPFITFFYQSNWVYLVSLLPNFWALELFNSTSETAFYTNLIIGFALNLSMITFLYWRYFSSLELRQLRQ